MLKTGKKTIMFSAYVFGWLVVAAVLAVLTWPKVETLYDRPAGSNNHDRKDSHDKKDSITGVDTRSDTDFSEDAGENTVQPEPGIKTPGTYIYATPSRIIIWTTIKLVDRQGNETYVKDITKDNFTIQESYYDNTHKAPVLEVKSSHAPVRAILVIDKSGSMGEASGIDQFKKMEVAKVAARLFVDQLLQSGSNSIAILPFSGEAVGRKNFLKGDKGDIWSSKDNAALLEESIQKLDAGGNTPLWQAIGVALDELSKAGDESYKVVVCLSDGMNNRGATSFPKLLAQVKGTQIPIFTIGYGGEGQLNSQELIQLSDESGAGMHLIGSFMRVSPRNLSARLQAIGADLSNLYELYWSPTGASPGTSVAVEIEIAYDSNGEHFETKEIRSYTSPQER